MGDHDRNAILARRALFISAALAGLGCTTHSSPNEAEPAQTSDAPKVVVEPPVPSDDPPSGPRPSWSEVMAAAPPLNVPEGLTEREEKLLINLASNQRARYEELERIWTAVLDCSPSASDCRAWSKIMEGLLTATDDGWGSLCGYSPEVSNTYIERRRVHAQYISSLAAMLIAELDAAVDALGNPADSEAWKAQREQLAEGRPRPCLSCMRPVASAITDAVAFTPGEAKLPPPASLDPVLARVSGIHQDNRANSTSRLFVRGHASASEADPESLAKQRAQAIADALIKLGVDKRDLVVRGYGASLPITNDPNQAALNCRVDFEVDVP